MIICFLDVEEYNFRCAIDSVRRIRDVKNQDKSSVPLPAKLETKFEDTVTNPSG